jgi:uncharacterized protein (DUF736 family)
MPVIGIFTPHKDGGWIGSIHTLTIDIKLRFIPNDDRDNDQSPAFHIYAGRSELGAAWRKRATGDGARDYLSVRLDDPSWPEPISAALFEVEEGKEARLIWSRRRIACD